MKWEKIFANDGNDRSQNTLTVYFDIQNTQTLIQLNIKKVNSAITK